MPTAAVSTLDRYIPMTLLFSHVRYARIGIAGRLFKPGRFGQVMVVDLVIEGEKYNTGEADSTFIQSPQHSCASGFINSFHLF